WTPPATPATAPRASWPGWTSCTGAGRTRWSWPRTWGSACTRRWSGASSRRGRPSISCIWRGCWPTWPPPRASSGRSRWRTSTRCGSCSRSAGRRWTPTLPPCPPRKTVDDSF
ncbi:unnamed protein product, partial [Heterosigma akashiwo]